MNLDPHSPTIQERWRQSHSYVQAARDKARTWIQQILFKSVFVSPKSYPAIARLNELSDIQTITGAYIQIEKRLWSTAIIESLQKENPSLLGNLALVRIRSNQPATSSFHVRLGLSSKDSCDRNICDDSSVIIDNRTHAVAMVDSSKEIRHWHRCQNYGHLARFGRQWKKLAVNVLASTPPAPVRLLQKISNVQTVPIITAGSRGCPVNAKAVNQYLNYISSWRHALETKRLKLGAC